MGGVHVIGTLDSKQCGPIGSLPFLMSQHALTSMSFVEIEDSVRYRFDPKMSEAVRISRLSNPSEENLKDFYNIIVTCCTHISVEESETLDPNILCVMGRWSAICKAEDDIYDRVSADGTEIVVLKSRDEQCSPG
eukprot:scaffold115693_cov24-Attheya_sp.AAC.1